MRLTLRAIWDKRFSPTRPVLKGKLYMKWEEPFVGLYGQETEIRLCFGYQKVTNWKKKRDWIAFYGKVGDGEFTDLRVPLNKDSYLSDTGSRDFCGSNRFHPTFDQDMNATAINITQSSISGQEAVIEFERFMVDESIRVMDFMSDIPYVVHMAWGVFLNAQNEDYYQVMFNKDPKNSELLAVD